MLGVIKNIGVVIPALVVAEGPHRLPNNLDNVATQLWRKE